MPTTADGIRAFGNLLSTCPVCAEPLSLNHRYWVLATAVPSSSAFDLVERYILTHDWAAASVYEWDAEQDSAQFTIIDCPNSELLGFVVTVHVAELFYNSYIQSRRVVDEVDTRALLRLAGDHWVGF
jgi:hypothetical protein